jgi:cytochrome c-type biogenesis protein CcmH/NrfF
VTQRVAVVTFLVSVALLAPWNVAQAQTPDERAADISREVMSPFCPGLTLHDCPTRAAEELRERIERWAATGRSDEAIMRALRDEYGPGIRAVPEDTYIVWLLPGLVLAGGLTLAYVVSRRWTRAGNAAASTPELASAGAAERGRLESELQGMRDRLGRSRS